MSAPDPEQLEHLEAALIDFAPRELCAMHRDDPSGVSWLPADLAQMVADSPACAAALAEHVALERELLALHETTTPGADPFFTRRVEHALPDGGEVGVDVPKRFAILSTAYGLALLSAIWIVSEVFGAQALLDDFHRIVDESVALAGGSVIGLSALAIGLAAVVVFGPRFRSPRAFGS